MISYTFSEEIRDQLTGLVGYSIRNIFLGKSGVSIEHPTTISSGQWLSIVFQKGKKYIDFKLNLEPLYQVDCDKVLDAVIKIYDNFPPRDLERIMNSLSFDQNLEVKDCKVENYTVNVKNSEMNCVRKISFFSTDNKCLVIDFETESPAGFEIRLVSNLNP